MIKHITEVHCDCCNKILLSKEFVVFLEVCFEKRNKKKFLGNLTLEQAPLEDFCPADMDGSREDEFFLCPKCVPSFFLQKKWF